MRSWNVLCLPTSLCSATHWKGALPGCGVLGEKWDVVQGPEIFHNASNHFCKRRNRTDFIKAIICHIPIVLWVPWTGRCRLNGRRKQREACHVSWAYSWFGVLEPTQCLKGTKEHSDSCITAQKILVVLFFSFPFDKQLLPKYPIQLLNIQKSYIPLLLVARVI